MNAREFFYLTANVRKTQDEYFRTKDQKVLRAARALEKSLKEQSDNAISYEEYKRQKELEK